MTGTHGFEEAAEAGQAAVERVGLRGSGLVVQIDDPSGSRPLAASNVPPPALRATAGRAAEGFAVAGACIVGAGEQRALVGHDQPVCPHFEQGGKLTHPLPASRRRTPIDPGCHLKRPAVSFADAGDAVAPGRAALRFPVDALEPLQMLPPLA